MARSFLEWVRAARRKYPLRDVAHVTLPHHAVAMMASYVLRPHRAPLATDLEARDPEALDLVLEGARFLGRHWFRAEIEGVEHVPREGAALLVGNHNGGFLTFDTYLTLAAIAEAQGLERAVRPLAHDFVFDDPILRRWAQMFGAIQAGHAPARAALARGDLVLVYPGGDVETFRRFRDRGRIDLGGRVGFVKLALRTGVPIVPVVSVGTHEQLVILSRGDAVAKLFHLHAWARTEVFPLALSVPWGLTSAFLPYLPLPAQTTVAFGPPLHFGRGDAEDEGLVRRCADQTIAAMQTLLDRLSQGRTPWLGRTGRRLGA
ncbi:MAG: acyltransferase family protein [Myxococcales bacterium]|nr:acyltransferase family protein [Myxococcales bacterium]